MTRFAVACFLWKKLKASCTWSPRTVSITGFEREQHVLKLSVPKMPKPSTFRSLRPEICWNESDMLCLPPIEQRPVQSARTFPALRGLGEPWGREETSTVGVPRIVPSWLSRWQQQQVTPLLTRGYTLHARWRNSRSGTAATRADRWEVVLMELSNSEVAFLQHVLQIAWRRQKNMHWWSVI